ncbi:MAG: glycosyltransferase family 2 protein [Bacteroidales bacterium]|nr:glycosyltransferase family 2 protein [Bacteroidales bacterium]
MKYSVVIPLYNKRAYILRAVESVLAQQPQPIGQRPDVELIVVDDGSTDDSYAIASQRLAGLKNCQVIHKENGGVGSARNIGIAAAKGEYICLLDADDWWEPTFLNRMEQLIGDYPDAAVYASGFYLVKNGHRRVAPIGVPPGFERGYINYCQVYARTLCMPVSSSSSVILKTAITDVGGFKEHLTLGEDFDLWIRLALKYKIAFENRPLSNYFQDVPVGQRATRRLHPPASHMLWNLDYLEEEEKRNADLKYLLDRLRCGGLFRYYLSDKYHHDAMTLLEKVDWSNQPTAVFKKYHSPRWLERSKYRLMKAASNLKQMLIRLKIEM